MCLALIASTSVIAQDKHLKDCPNQSLKILLKTEKKKACCKDKAAADKKLVQRRRERNICKDL